MAHSQLAKTVLVPFDGCYKLVGGNYRTEKREK